MLILLLLLQDDWSFAETPKVLVGGREWWVAPGGSDTASGSKERPFASVTKALEKADAGDVIQVRKGVYRGEKPKLNFAKSGRPDAWIVLRSADGPGEAEIDGEGKPLELFLISGRSYVLIEGLAIHGSQDNAVHIGTDSSYVLVRNCRIWDARGGGDAIKVNGSHHVYVENNDVSRGGDELIDFMHSGYCVSRGNYMHDQAKGKTATFAKGGSHYILMERNVVVGIRGAHAIMLGGDSGKGLFEPKYPDIEATKMIVRNNVVVDCDDSAIEVRGCREGWILNNTAVGCSTTFGAIVIRPGRTNDGGVGHSSDIHIFNNLMWNDGDLDKPYVVDPASAKGLKTGNNWWWNGKAGVPRKGDLDVRKEAGSRVDVDPRLRSFDLAVKGWKDAERFSLRSESPAVNAGVAHPLLKDDFLGKKRDRLPDVGAFEK